MLILGIESATSAVGVALGGREGVLAQCSANRGRRHAESLVPMIEFVLDQGGVERSGLGAVAVDIGPGLFTGLRVGISTAKAVAFALGLPMVGISSLDLLAFDVRSTPRLIAAAIDARRGEVYSALYRHVPGGVQRVTEPRVGSPADLVAELLACGEAVLLVGDAAARHSELADGLAEVELSDEVPSRPSAEALVRLAHARATREEFRQHDEIRPVYLRRPDAEINWATRDGS